MPTHRAAPSRRERERQATGLTIARSLNLRIEQVSKRIED
jgi:hypothetical protein